MVPVIRVQIDDRWYTVEVDDLTTSPVRALVDGEPVEVHVEQPSGEQPSGDADPPKSQSPVADDAPAPPQPSTARTSGTSRTFYTPMPGTIISVAVKEGDQVVTGDEVCVLEAIKMQQRLRADWTGIVRAVHVQPGQQVSDGDPIIELE